MTPCAILKPCPVAGQPPCSGLCPQPRVPGATPSRAPQLSGGHTPLSHPSLQPLPGRGPLPSLPPYDVRGGVPVMSHPSICLAASPATQPPVSRVSPEPCLLHPLHVVSVWAGAGGPGPAPSGWTAGAWSWHRTLATGAVRWGTGGTRGGGSHPRPSRGPAGGVLAAPGGLRMGRGGWPQKLWLASLGHRGSGRGGPTKGRGASAPDPQAPQSLSQGFPVLLPGQPFTAPGVCA